MVELRKRKTPPQAAEKPTKKATGKNKGPLTKMKDAIAEKVDGAMNTTTPGTGAPEVDSIIDLANFGGNVETQDGQKVTLKDLVDKSKAGVVLFTYPKASTPGCTTQACLFRDTYETLTSTGLDIYGLSSDSVKANTTFKTKQKLPYSLLCDPSAVLIGAIGMKKSPKGTKRGVFVVDKDGKVLACEGGGPQATVDVVKRAVDSMHDPMKPSTTAEQAAELKPEDAKPTTIAAGAAES